MSDNQNQIAQSNVQDQLSDFQYTILCTLAERPMYGLELKEVMQATYGTEINHGRLYPNLNELAERGYLDKSKLDNRSNEYAITEQGLFMVLERIQWEISVLLRDEERINEINADILKAVREELNYD